MSTSHFQRGSGCYTCNRCHKQTRSTGRGDNEHVGLCAACYDLSGDENAVADGTMTQEEFDNYWGTRDPLIVGAIMSKTTRKSSKTRKTTKKQTHRNGIVKNEVKNFEGKITATHVYRRTMKEFKNCQAYCWLVVNETSSTYWTANSYNGDTPRCSWKPSDYEYALTDKAVKLIAKKLSCQDYQELEVTDWPAWIENAGRGSARKGRKAGKSEKAATDGPSAA